MKALFVESRPLNGLGPLARLAARGHRVDLATAAWEALARTDPEAVEGARASVGLVPLPAGSTGDAEAIEAALRRVGRRLADYEAVLTLADDAVETAAHLARRVGRVHATPEAVARAKDKAETRRLLTAAGLPQPNHARVRDLDDARAAAAAIGYPVVVKPARLSAARGVSRADDPVDLEAAVTVAARATQQAGRGGDPILIEGLVEGPQVSAEILSRGRERLVLGFTDRLPPLGGFAERGGAFPAAFPMEAEARRVAAAALDAIGFTDGAAHVEMRCGPNGPVVIEINPRLAGFVVPELVEVATGLDVYDALVRLHAGGSLPTAPAESRVGALRPVFAPRAGVLRGIDVTRARSAPGVTGVYVFRSPGDRVRVAADNRDRLGAVVAAAGTAEEAGLAAEAACARVEVAYELESSSRAR